jgi:glycosyltransferase involved in cell wall biosynthesis
MNAANELLITIAIPTHNRASGYLRQAITSAVSQTYRNIEIVVSDNCSVDDTERVVRSFGDQRIRYFKQVENIGANNNFNFCVQQARGDYFLLLHDDDLIDDDFIDVCLRAANYRTDVGVIRTGTRICDAVGNVICKYPNMTSGYSTDDLFRGWFKNETSFYLCSTLFNTCKLREIGGFRSKHNLFQDVMAELQLAAYFGRIDVQDIKASFRSHPDEMTHLVKVSQWCEDSLYLLNTMCDLASLKNKKLIRKEGMHFFSQINYRRVLGVRSLFSRLAGYCTVFKMFGYRHLPSRNHFVLFVYYLLHDTPLYGGLRAIKRKLMAQ